MQVTKLHLPSINFCGAYSVVGKPCCHFFDHKLAVAGAVLSTVEIFHVWLVHLLDHRRVDVDREQEVGFNSLAILEPCGCFEPSFLNKVVLILPVQIVVSCVVGCGAVIVEHYPERKARFGAFPDVWAPGLLYRACNFVVSNGAGRCVDFECLFSFIYIII